MDRRCDKEDGSLERIDESIEDWKEKRHRTFMYWCFVHFIHGMVHSIRYSSQYLYFKDVMKVRNPDFLYGVSVSLIGVTGVVFPLIISPYVDRTRNTMLVIAIVNITGFVGNLLYALPFSPALVLIGQLVAGTTPAFGVLAMGEISRTYSSLKLTKKVSVLSWIYSVGTFTSIGLVFSFLYVDFRIGSWHINYAVMPGLFMAFAFMVSAASSCLLVTDVSKEFDMKVEERMKRSSCGSSPAQTLSDCYASPDLKEYMSYSLRLSPSSNSHMPPSVDPQQAVGDGLSQAADGVKNEAESTASPSNHNLNRFGLPVIDDLYESENDDFIDERALLSGAVKSTLPNLEPSLKGRRCSAARDTLKWIIKILRHRTTALLMFITFMEAFIYSLIVTTLPVLASKYLGWGKVELALLSMANKFFSVLVSGSVYFLADYLMDFLLLVYGVELSLISLLSLAVLELTEESKIAASVMLFTITALSIAGIPLIITSTRSLLAKIVPSEIQSLTEAVRMSVFEASFVPAGFLVPVVAENLPATSIGLLIISLFVVVMVVLDRSALVNPKEEDDFWWKTNGPVGGTSPTLNRERNHASLLAAHEPEKSEQ